MQPETEIELRHRILIAAAVAAVIEGARIREIKPAAWTRRRPAGERRAPAYPRPVLVCAPETVGEPEEEAAACGS
jgi:hypothetical protein